MMCATGRTKKLLGLCKGCSEKELGSKKKNVKSNVLS